MNHVQFSSADEAKIIAVFGCTQDLDVYPNQGQVADDDPRYLAFINPVVTPASVSRRQGRLALLDAEKLDDVEALIAELPDAATKRRAQIEYEADTWERSNVFLQAVWEQIGGTPEGLDALFVSAAAM